MGRVAGDLFAGFALGFIGSGTTNPAYAVNGTNQPYGDSPSGAWWGGNEYPAANTNLLAYSDVNSFCSLWGSLIYSGTHVTYGQPIYDRMKGYGDAAATAVIEPPVAINGTPNIWMVEFDFYDGVATVAPKGAQDFYTLIYRAGAGGLISGGATQQVAAGGAGTAVAAVGADTSAVFHAWSDGLRQASRTDSNVHASAVQVALFRSRGGADLDWYADHGYEPEGEEEWSDLDTVIITNKGDTLLEECIADTDPSDTGDVFRVTGISTVPVVSAAFEPSSTGRLYQLYYLQDLVAGDWTNVPGTSPRAGTGGADALQDTNTLPNAFYRIAVEMMP